jgi:hypothetical protein
MGTASIPQSLFAPWARKHDKPGTPLVPAAPLTFFPRSLEDLITICRDRPAGMGLHAAGSHWALSKAAVSDHSFIETHDPHEIFRVMGRTLRNVVPTCMSDQFLADLNQTSMQLGRADRYFVHFESSPSVRSRSSLTRFGTAAIAGASPTSPAGLLLLLRRRRRGRRGAG